MCEREKERERGFSGKIIIEKRELVFGAKDVYKYFDFECESEANP